MASNESSEGEGLSESKPTPDEAERQAHEEFCRNHSAPEYQARFNRLYPWWREFKAAYFPNVEMKVPRISIGFTTSRRLSDTRLATDYGAPTNIVFRETMMFGTDRRLIRTDNPAAEGWLRLIADRLLGEMVKQYVLEVLGSNEEGWDGYGPHYAREATRIGEMIGLGEVYPRRRGLRLAGLPVAASWPHAFRPEGYYLGHVSLEHLSLLGRGNRQPSRQSAAPGILEYLHVLASTNQHARLLDILGREVDAGKVARKPAIAAAERSPINAAGKPLPLPVIDPNWLLWNDGLVRIIAEGILARRAFDGMPILADALQDAGCEDEVLLGHLRAHCDHTANCWALRLLTEPAST